MKITIDEVCTDSVEVVNDDLDTLVVGVSYTYTETKEEGARTYIQITLKAVEVQDVGEDPQTTLFSGASEPETGAGNSSDGSPRSSRLFDDRGNRRVYGG